MFESWLGKGFVSLGVEGFYFEQVTCDGGDGATLGCFKGKMAGLGPVVGYVHPSSKTESLVLELKWLAKMDTQKRLEGDQIRLERVHRSRPSPGTTRFRQSEEPMTERSRVTLLAALAVTLLSPQAALAVTQAVQGKPGAPGEWRVIGQTHARHDIDHDQIFVQGPFDNFRKIKFKVTDSPLRIHRMVVTYDNGAPDKIEIRQNIPKGGQSRAIDLRGIGKRSVRKIEFWYDTKGILNGRADVTIFGQK